MTDAMLPSVYFPMSYDDFIGQRADKAIVKEVLEPDDEEADTLMVAASGGRVKKVEHYTVTCNECDNGVGYYDEKGDIICDSCGMVLNERPTAIPDGFKDGRGFDTGDDGVKEIDEPI